VTWRTTKHAGKEIDLLDHLQLDGHLRTYAPVKRAIFDALCAHPYGLSARKLAELVYADREDGGPEWALNCITARITQMNKQWVARGSCLRIKSRGHWGYQIWIMR